MIKLLALISLFLVSCKYYVVEQTTICKEQSPAFKCEMQGDLTATLAICETEKECREICDKARKGQ